MKLCFRLVFAFLLIGRPFFPVAAAAQPGTAQSDRIAVRFDSSEAEAVLAIVDKRAAGKSIEDADWNALFTSEPYVRLKKREASMHRDFTDEDFRKFVLSDDLLTHATELRRTLPEWRQADLSAAARRVLAYLPSQARIRPKVYPVIKPKKNSFVFESNTDPAIFLYLDPSVTREQFENTVAHEMHHIGFASLESEKDAQLANLPPATKSAVEWMGAFGEGFAMLAASGSPDIHPHTNSKPEDRARWDRDMANFNQDVRTLDEFFLDIVHGKFKTKDDVDAKGYSFFGIQGPWYTVGYKMAVTIEKQFGRERLIACMTNVRELLPTYNQAAAEQAKKSGETPTLWSQDLIRAIAENK
jgi:hypothetical protein